jgi:hypothetical protein
LCERVEQRLVYALTRFGAGVERVAVRLSDEKNALGGLDTRCQMRAWLRDRSSISVETLDGWAALERAVDRLVVRIELALVDGQVDDRSSLMLPVARLGPAILAGGEDGSKARKPPRRRSDGSR